MTTDRITEIRIAGMRCLEDVRLRLDGLRVLIGENGSGKSCIIEACELLHRAAGQSFLTEIDNIHGGLFSLLRHGSRSLNLGATVEGDGPRLDYSVRLSPGNSGAYAVVGEERLDLGPLPGHDEPLHLIMRKGGNAKVYSGSKHGLQEIGDPGGELLLPMSIGLFSSHPGFERMRAALSNIEVHIPFETLPLWAARAHQRNSIPREQTRLASTTRLERFAANLANTFHALRTEHGEEHWQETMEYVRLGLGPQVESVNVRPGAGGNTVALWLKLFGRDEQLSASVLADGWIAFLGFVAMTRLGQGRSLLAFDEPELHLHPNLVSRVIGLFETIAKESSVLIATHSDRLLDSLETPDTSVVVCDLDEQMQRTRLRTLDPEALSAWMERYSGVGSIRDEGHLDSLLAPEEAG